ncbi:MAG: hypothetical protein PWR26_745 [Methanosarcinales archaeon]|nr:hypothetical protein [Methanosarcinales archaeon]MDN5295649.1 hypothetical protein [Methanosarcinales archaeon]
MKKEERRRMVEHHLRKKVENSTQVEKEYKAIKIPSYLYDELSRLKAATGVKTYGRLIAELLAKSEIDPTRVAERKIEQLEGEIGELVPHAYGAISQALVLCRWAIRMDRAQCERLQMELLSLLRELRREADR